MLFNYLKTALRAIRKDKQHFFLNLIGFSIGLAAAILMALFAQNELSYDKHQPDSERVYLAHTDYTSVGLQVTSNTIFNVANRLKNNSQLEASFTLGTFSPVNPYVSDLVEVNGNYLSLNGFYAASSNILDFINLEILTGDITQAFSKIDQLVLSESEAKRIFGSINIIGKSLNHKKGQYTIGAVFKDLPDNTHFKFDSLLYMPSNVIQDGEGYVYYKLLPNADLSAFNKQLTKEHHILRPWMVTKAIKMKLINIEDLHLESNGPFVMKKGGSLTVLKIYITLSAVLVLIASINFINLNIAQSAKRAKEVGVRKALGATKSQLVMQFLTESFLVVALAGLIAFALVELMLPQFNQMMDRQLSFNYGSQFMIITTGVILAVGMLSGLYPALFTASFSAKRVLSRDLVIGGTAIFIRKLTLCFQGALSISLIIAAASLFQQMVLIDNLDIGYEKSSRLMVRGLPSEALYKKEHNPLFAAIKKLPGVLQVTASNTDLTHVFISTLDFVWPNGTILEGRQPTIFVSYDAVETLGLTMLAGRGFSPDFSSDWFQRDKSENTTTVGVIVSRRMLELAGYSSPESVIGLILTSTHVKIKAKIVGVIENVKIGSAREQALPMSLYLGNPWGGIGNLVIKASNVNMATLRKQVQHIITNELQLSDVQITTISDDYANAHKNEQRALEMVTVFSCLAIFLTCLGTFGLASFSTLSRQKEVAMRKVLGASRLSIVNLLAKEFLLLVAVSIAIAYPLSYWLVGDWLANFNDRIEQTLWVYGFAALAVTAITWLTVASLAFKAASTRPSLILRDE
jgi:putative ABC transport system permease protein